MFCFFYILYSYSFIIFSYYEKTKELDLFYKRPSRISAPKNSSFWSIYNICKIFLKELEISTNQRTSHRNLQIISQFLAGDKFATMWMALATTFEDFLFSKR